VADAFDREGKTLAPLGRSYHQPRWAAAQTGEGATSLSDDGSMPNGRKVGGHFCVRGPMALTADKTFCR
jgi:hypothetical protein